MCKKLTGRQLYLKYKGKMARTMQSEGIVCGYGKNNSIVSGHLIIKIISGQGWNEDSLAETYDWINKASKNNKLGYLYISENNII